MAASVRACPLRGNRIKLLHVLRGALVDRYDILKLLTITHAVVTHIPAHILLIVLRLLGAISFKIERETEVGLAEINDLGYVYLIRQVYGVDDGISSVYHYECFCCSIEYQNDHNGEA